MAVCWGLLSMIIFDVPFSGLPLVWLNVSPAACPEVRKQQPLGDAKKHMRPFIHCFLAYLLYEFHTSWIFSINPFFPQRQKRFSRVAGGSVYTNDVAWCLHKLYAYTICSIHVVSYSTEFFRIFRLSLLQPHVSCLTNNYQIIFLFLGLGPSPFFSPDSQCKIGSGSTWMNAQSYHIFGWEFLRWWDICWSGTWWSRAGGGGPFLTKVTGRKHRRIWTIWW